MKLYLRILSYLKPHLPVFMTAVGAMVCFAALDAFSLALIIPFLQTLFNRQGGGGQAGSGGGAQVGGGAQADPGLPWVRGRRRAQRRTVSWTRSWIRPWADSWT